MQDLAGTVALVTGASSGLGARFARVLAGAGAKVVAAARRTDRLEALQAEMTDSEVLPVALDVTDEASIEACFDAAEARFGSVNAVINNAGMNAAGAAIDLPAEEFDRLFAVNVRGVFLTARIAARRLIAAGAAERGRIVNIASIGALRTLPGLAPYCASKAAVAMLTKGLARDWARHGINVNAICPGYVETEINADWLASEGGEKMIKGFPRRRLLRAEDLDDLILYLAGPRSAFVTGSIFTVDDGQSL